MKLIDMLTKTSNDTEVLIYCTNTYNESVLVFQGKISAARINENIWTYLADEVVSYYIINNTILIFIKDEFYTKKDWHLYYDNIYDAVDIIEKFKERGEKND